MKITIRGNPVFELSVTADMVEALFQCSTHHYDGLCKSVGRQGGFLYGWRNIAVQYDNPPDEVYQVHGSFHDLDITLKLMEIAHSLPNTKISQEMHVALREYSLSVRAALNRANQLAISRQWREDLP